MTEPTTTDSPAVNGVDLRALLKQRTDQKIRRIRKQWFCLDVEIQAALDAATEKLAELVGAEVQRQQLRQQAGKKYAMPSQVAQAEADLRELREKSRQVGVMGVFQHLTDDQLEAMAKIDKRDSFGRAQKVLSMAWLRWEDADGNPIPDEHFGRAELDMLLDPDVLERGEWLPLALKLATDSSSVIDRPTSPA